MSNFEIEVTESFPLIFNCWHRFVDDIFCIVKKNLVHDALKLLNLQEIINTNCRGDSAELTSDS